MIDLKAAYQERLLAGDLRPDPAQEAALDVLEDLANALCDYKPQSQGFLSRLFWGPLPPPSGLYIYGGVGRGKSMLMDLFFDAVTITKKRRVHFHQFMLEIHERLHRLETENTVDILPQVAQEIAQETWLLCFDEFHVGNIADAMILGRLFENLFANGVVVVSTSNWAPDNLYKDGLQRDRFLPFIDLIEKRMRIYHLDGTIDHRFEQTQKIPCYFYPLNKKNTNQLHNIFFQLTNSADPDPIALPVQGRLLRITHAAKGVGFFNYDELCKTALGSADYLEIAKCLNTVLIDEVPRMSSERRDETMRFINLVDALYEAKVRLYIAAETTPEKLQPPGELNFPFQRTLSRLIEMQSEEYRKKAHFAD